MAAGAKVVFIPGTKIASMSKFNGQEAKKAGIQVRTQGVQNATQLVNQNVLVGVQKATQAVSFTFSQVQTGLQGGLIILAAKIRDDMEKTPPLVPVDTGALRAGYKINVKAGGKDPMVEAGWSDTQVDKGDGKEVEQYAAYVHEMTSPPYGKVNWSRPGSGPKFLEASLKRNASKANKIIATHLKRVLR